MLIPFKNIVRKYGKPKGILHCGANIAEEAKAYHDEGVNKVIWIEGNPEIFPQLQANIAQYPGNIAYNYCVGQWDGMESELHVANNGSQSSSVLELGTHKIVHPDVHYTHDIPVTLRRIDKIFDELPGYDFLNMDLQGFEMHALIGMGSLLNQFKYAYLEVNWKELYVGCALYDEMVRFMRTFGFKVAEFKECGKTSWGDCLWIKR